MIDPHAYDIKVRSRTIEGATMFEALVRELPDLAEYADSHDEAYALAIDAINTTAQIFAEQGRGMPAPEKAVEDK